MSSVGLRGYRGHPILLLGLPDIIPASSSALQSGRSAARSALHPACKEGGGGSGLAVAGRTNVADGD